MHLINFACIFFISWGGVHFFFLHVKNLFLLHCVPLYVCRLCINYQDLRTNLLGMAALHILLLTFIYNAITTDDRHPLRSRSINQNTANCMMIRFRYIAQLGGGGLRKTYCARSRNDVRRLTSRSNSMPSKKLMESLVRGRLSL